MENEYQWTPEERARREETTKRLEAEAAAQWAARYPKAAKRREAAQRAAEKRAARRAAPKPPKVPKAPRAPKPAPREAAAAQADGREARAAYMAAESRIWWAAFHRVKRRPSNFGSPEAIARNKAEALNAAAWAVERWAAASPEALKLKAAADAEEAAEDVKDLF